MNPNLNFDHLELAKCLIPKVLANGPQPVEEVYRYCRTTYPVNKREVKEARRQLGVKSESKNGITFWSLPNEKFQPED